MLVVREWNGPIVGDQNDTAAVVLERLTEGSNRRCVNVRCDFIKDAERQTGRFMTYRRLGGLNSSKDSARRTCD